MRLKTKKKLISSIPTPGVLNWICQKQAQDRASYIQEGESHELY